MAKMSIMLQENVAHPHKIHYAGNAPAKPFFITLNFTTTDFHDYCTIYTKLRGNVINNSFLAALPIDAHKDMNVS